jgi:uncharacterized membrane protein
MLETQHPIKKDKCHHLLASLQFLLLLVRVRQLNSLNCPCKQIRFLMMTLMIFCAFLRHKQKLT